jgi:hypothetical protein
VEPGESAGQTGGEGFEFNYEAWVRWFESMLTSRSGQRISALAADFQRYKGRIWVESETGNDSTFYFTLRAKTRCSTVREWVYGGECGRGIELR